MSEEAATAQASVLREVHEVIQRGDRMRAAQLAQAALNEGLEHSFLLNVAALPLEDQGRHAEALTLLERAVRLAPADISSRNALGLCLLQLERPVEALEHFDALIRMNSSLPFAHANRGTALLQMGQVASAEAAFQEALAGDPKQAIALAGLAQIASGRGASTQARQWAEQALERIPGLPRAVMSLVSAQLTDRQAPQAEARIRSLLGDERLTALERAYANGLLGDALDAQGKTQDAFAAYTACNEALRRVYAPRHAVGTTALEYARSLSRYLERADRARWGTRVPVGPDFSGVRGHVFLLGFPRSGTTLLEVILEGHAQIASLEEHELLIDSVQQFMQQPEDLERLAQASPGVLEAARQAYWRRVAESRCEVAGKVFLDKHPLNTLKLPLIARLFPGAKILFACRDPRDIVLSCFRHRFQMSAPIYELLSIEGAARYYDAVMRVLVRVTGLWPLDIALIRHEDLVSAFAREMRRICEFLGISWDPAMGDFALRTRDRAVVTPSTAQLVHGLSTEGLGHWRRYEEQLAPVLGLLEPWVKRFYYDDR